MYLRWAALKPVLLRAAGPQRWESARRRLCVQLFRGTHRRPHVTELVAQVHLTC